MIKDADIAVTENLATSSQEVVSWLDSITPLFFDGLAHYDKILRRSNLDVEVNRRPEELVTGYNLCKASAYALGEALRIRFNLSADAVRIAEGGYNTDRATLSRTDDADSWLRVTLPDKELVVHPTYGQFDPGFTQKFLIDEAETEEAHRLVSLPNHEMPLIYDSWLRYAVNQYGFEVRDAHLEFLKLLLPKTLWKKAPQLLLTDTYLIAPVTSDDQGNNVILKGLESETEQEKIFTAKSDDGEILIIAQRRTASGRAEDSDHRLSADLKITGESKEEKFKVAESLQN